MSGIVGVVLSDQGSELEPSTLERMAQPLRAPVDSPGSAAPQFARFGPAGFGVAGFWTPSTSVFRDAAVGAPALVAVHGRVLNLDELDAHSPPGDLHAERILRVYRRLGIDFVGRLRGEFAIALWDGASRTLHLVTDRFRIHSMVYYRDHRGLVFASRMGALAASGLAAQLTIRPEAIVDFVGSSFIPTPATIYREVSKVPPGTILTWRGGEPGMTSYWEIDYRNPTSAGRRTLARELKERFAAAVDAQLRPDRAATSDSVGAFLSGGIDSSTVAAVLTRQLGHPVKTFSIGFGEQQFNEISYARVVARTFGTDHHEYFVTPRDAAEAIPHLVDAFDEPYANASAVPTYYCARLAREHGVQILYAGDGGDELFGGNSWYASGRVFDHYGRLPAWPRDRVLRPAVFALAAHTGLAPFVRAKRYIERASVPYPLRLTSHGFWNVIPPAALLAPDFLASLAPDYHPYMQLMKLYEDALATTLLDRQLSMDLKHVIGDNDLFKVTRMTEAAGTGVRFPFLDQALAEFAATVPARVKLKGGKLRAFFKWAYADLLPPETRRKRKHGFGLPIAGWLKTDARLNEMMRDLVTGTSSVSRRYFRPAGLEDLIARHTDDSTTFYGTILWNLMMLELWHRKRA